MKKIYQTSYVILAALLWISCGQTQESSSPLAKSNSSANELASDAAERDKEWPKVENMINITCPDHVIDFDTLYAYTSAFISDSKLKEVAKNVSFGGVLSAESLVGEAFHTKREAFDGFAGWWCWNDKIPNGLNELFVAIEHHSRYDEFNIPNYPVSDTVTISQNNFTYGGTVAQLKDYLEVQTTSPILPDTLVPTDAIKDFARYFRFKFPHKYNGDNYNEKSVAFFRNDSNCNTLNYFLTQFAPYTFPYVRYYYGLNVHNETNKMRLILVPVDSHGKNITTYNGEPAHYLEHTFP